jgi:hypothetical protein
VGVWKEQTLMARVDEVADGIYRISTLEPETEFQFNQFLIEDERPALIYTGMFPSTKTFAGRWPRSSIRRA